MTHRGVTWPSAHTHRLFIGLYAPVVRLSGLPWNWSVTDHYALPVEPNTPCPAPLTGNTRAGQEAEKETEPWSSVAAEPQERPDVSSGEQMLGLPSV